MNNIHVGTAYFYLLEWNANLGVLPHRAGKLAVMWLTKTVELSRCEVNGFNNNTHTTCHMNLAVCFPFNSYSLSTYEAHRVSQSDGEACLEHSTIFVDSTKPMLLEHVILQSCDVYKHALNITICMCIVSLI